LEQAAVATPMGVGGGDDLVVGMMVPVGNAPPSGCLANRGRLNGDAQEWPL